MPEYVEGFFEFNLCEYNNNNDCLIMYIPKKKCILYNTSILVSEYLEVGR